MVRAIDHYEYWNRNRDKKKQLLDREIISLKLISQIIKENENFLDLGCGNGDFLLQVRKKSPKVKLSGIVLYRRS